MFGSYKQTTLECPCCKKTFWSECNHGGAIEHNNVLSNISCYIARYRDGEDVLRSLANIDGIFCNIKDNSYKVGVEIFKCAIIALRLNCENEMADELESRFDEIKGFYNEVTNEYIKENQKELEKLKGRLIK